MAFGHWMEITEGDVRLRLGPPTKEEFTRFVSPDAGFGMQSYEVARYFGGPPAPTLQRQEEAWDENAKSKDSVSWGVFVPDGEDWTMVGSTVLIFREHDRRIAESGFIVFDRSHWGRRVASTAHLGRTLYAFHELDLLAIRSEVDAPNHGSNKALQGIGYVRTGITYGHGLVGGKILDTNRYLLVNPAEEAWRYFWRRPDDEIPAELHAGREVARRTMERAAAAVRFL